MANILIFFAEKKNVSSFFIANATHIFAVKMLRYLKTPFLLVINELVKLTML